MRRNRREAEGIRGRADEDVRRDGASCFFLVIEDRAGPERHVNVVLRQMRVQRLAVMMLGFVGVEMDVQKRREDRACLDQHDEGGRGQPAKHRGIVVKDEWPGT